MTKIITIDPFVIPVTDDVCDMLGRIVLLSAKLEQSAAHVTQIEFFTKTSPKVAEKSLRKDILAALEKTLADFSQNSKVDRLVNWEHLLLGIEALMARRDTLVHGEISVDELGNASAESYKTKGKEQLEVVNLRELKNRLLDHLHIIQLIAKLVERHDIELSKELPSS